jgi:hypothetical protein
VLAAEINTINERRTKTLAKSIVEISFIKPPKGTKGWVLATTSFSVNWEQILREQVTCPSRSCGQEMKIGAVKEATRLGRLKSFARNFTHE